MTIKLGMGYEKNTACPSCSHKGMRRFAGKKKITYMCPSCGYTHTYKK